MRKGVVAFALLLGGLLWLRSRGSDAALASGSNGRLGRAEMQVARAGELAMAIGVVSQAQDSRLFEVAWTVTHPNWQRRGDTLLREIAPQGTEQYGVIQPTPAIAAGERLQVDLYLFSRSLCGMPPVQDDAQRVTLTAP